MRQTGMFTKTDRGHRMAIASVFAEGEMRGDPLTWMTVLVRGANEVT